MSHNNARPLYGLERASAQVLDAINALWLKATPPPFLTATTGIDDRFAAEDAVVEVHWDGVVRMMGEDGAGYAMVQRLYERLRVDMESGEQALTDAATRHAEVRDVLETVQRAANSPESTLRSDLGWPPKRPLGQDGDRRWRWEAVPSDDHGPDRYRLVLIPATYNQRFQPPDDLTVFLADSTWAEVRTRLIDEFHQTRADRQPTDRHRLLVFRYETVGSVLEIFDLTGTVSVYRTYFPEGRPLVEGDVRIACVAHRELESEATFTSKTQVVLHVRDCLADEGEAVSERSVREALTRLGAYREVKRADGRDHDKGGQTPAGAAADLEHLRARVRDICSAEMKVE